MLARVAAKPKTVSVENPPDADEIIDAPLTPELKLEKYFASIPSGETDISIGLYQVDPADRRRKGFLFYIEPDELAIHDLFEKILAEWGAGEYEAIAQDGGEIAFSQRFVLGSIKKKERYRAPSPVTPTPSSGIDPTVLAILDRQQATLDKLVENQQRPQQSTLETLKELRAMQELVQPVAPAPAPGTGLENVLGIVQSVLQLRDELGGGNGDDALTAGIKTLGPAIVKAVEAMQASPRIPAPGADLGPGTPARAPEVNAQGAGRLIGPYLPTIVANARGGVLPTDAARQILGQLAALPPEAMQGLLDYLDDDQAVDKLAAMEPEIIQLREWFDQLVDVLCASIRQLLGDAGELVEQPEGELEGDLIPGGPGREVGEWPAAGVESAPATQGADIAPDANATGGDNDA